MLTALAHSIVAHPWVYDKVQFVAGAKHVLERLEPILQQTHGDTVLDVGGGTGIVQTILPPLRAYFLLDNDPMKLAGLRQKKTSARGILGDATTIPLKNKSVDDVFCLNVLHHLEDHQVASFLREAARIARKRFILLDPLHRPHSLVSRMLWKYDRGSNPRTMELLCAAVQKQFQIEHTERFAVYHEYLICVGKAR